MFLRYMRCVLFFFFIFHLLNNDAFAKERAPIQEVVKDLKAYVEQYRELFQTPGMAFVIVKDGEVFIETFGQLSLDDPTPVDEATLFQVASVTKNFTATLIMRLVEKGILSLDDKVTRYLPDFALANPQATDDLRVRDLLTHNIGIGNFAGDSFWHGGLSQEEVLKAMKDIPLQHPLRTHYGYSNIMVGIAGLVIEKATGKSLSRVMEEEIFHPLHMDHSSMGYEAAIKTPSLFDRVIGFFKGTQFLKRTQHHDIYKGKAKKIPTTPQFFLFPGTSGVNTTPCDMAKWMLFHLSNTKVNDAIFLSKDSVQTMRTPYADASDVILGAQFPKDRMKKVEIGMGWFMGDFGVEGNHVSILNQMGGTGGVRGLLSIVPEENLGIAVMCNLGGMRSSLFPEGIVQKCLDLYLKIKGRDYAKDLHEKFLALRDQSKRYVDTLRLQNPQPHASLSLYEGHYKNKLYGDVTLKLSPEKTLQMHYRGRTVPLTHINGHHFLCYGAHLGLGFESDDVCFVELGMPSFGQKAYGLMISLLDEGENPAFYRETPSNTKPLP